MHTGGRLIKMRRRPALVILHKSMLVVVLERKLGFVSGMPDVDLGHPEKVQELLHILKFVPLLHAQSSGPILRSFLKFFTCTGFVSANGVVQVELRFFGNRPL